MFNSKLKFLAVFVVVALITIMTQVPSASAELFDSLPDVPASRTSIKANGKDDSNKFFPNACVRTPTDLISWYRAENNADDSQGTNHGTLQNGTTFAAGKVGQSFNFTAFNQSVEIPDNASLDLTNAVTLEAWVAPSQIGASNDGTTIITKGDLTAFGNQPFGLFYNSAGRVVMRVGNSSTFSVNTISTTSLPLDTFSHVVGTYDGTTAKIYINGVLEDSDNEGIGAMTTNNLPVRIGANNLSGFLGKIDEASIYSRALSEAEITAIFNADGAGKCLAPTAASVQVGGRVATANGRGISRARVELTDVSGAVRTTYTNTFGYYRFHAVSAGETYVLSVKSKRHTFAVNTSVLFVYEDVSGINFTALP